MNSMYECLVCDADTSAAALVAREADLETEFAADVAAVNRKLAARDRWITVLERNAATASVTSGTPLNGTPSMQSIFRFRSTNTAAFTSSGGAVDRV